MKSLFLSFFYYLFEIADLRSFCGHVLAFFLLLPVVFKSRDEAALAYRFSSSSDCLVLCRRLT